MMAIAAIYDNFKQNFVKEKKMILNICFKLDKKWKLGISLSNFIIPLATRDHATEVVLTLVGLKFFIQFMLDSNLYS